jgi:hypothetical protein
MTGCFPSEDDPELFTEAIDALRELVSRARAASDRSFDDGHSVDEWQSDELNAAIKRAEAVIARAGPAAAKPIIE